MNLGIAGNLIRAGENLDKQSNTAEASPTVTKVAVGDYVTFGTYPQTAAGNDETPIEWLVLDRNGDNVLLLSRYGLDAQPYHTEWKSITWETCTLRTWLNNDFMNRAFTASERSAIQLTNVDNSSSQCYSGYNKTSGGSSNTQDKVFLLSYKEASKYLGVTADDNSNNIKSRVAPTAYAVAQGAWQDSKYTTENGMTAGWWWLRSPGYYMNDAADISTYGVLRYSDVYYDSGSVRPALWVNVELINGYELTDKQSNAVEVTSTATAHNTKVDVGDYVTFGTYPQTAEGDDETPIEWLVLDRDGDNVLLLSRYGLDNQPYNEKNTSITWEKCTLRTWLNNDFMNRAFTVSEQSAIQLTNVDNSSSQCYSGHSTNGGNNTQDKVFLLSYAEANKYLDITYNDRNNTKSRVALTAYAIAQGAGTSSSYRTADGQAAGWWWLRSPGTYQDAAASVNTAGSLHNRNVHNDSISVRPALWVNLENAGNLIRACENLDKQSNVVEVSSTATTHNTNVAVGDYVTFGTYPQTAEGNDETPIEWLVLDRDGDNVLLLSRYGLDAQPYNEKNTSITWEKCTLRTWLNKDFIKRAFTEAEQSAIQLTNVDNSSQCYSGWSTSGGNNTQDKVFLLSYAEANKYLGVTYTDSSNTKSRVAPTAYAIAKGVWPSSDIKTADGQAAGEWWLRSPGSNQYLAADVSPYGSLDYNFVNYEGGSVRPALWVNFESRFV